MKMNFKKLAALALVGASFLASCSDDNSDNDNNGNGEFAGNNPYVMVLAYPPASGYDYTYYPIQYETLAGDAEYSAEGTGQITQLGYYEYLQLDQTIYSTGGLDYTDVSAITRGADGLLDEAPFGINFTNSIEDMVSADDGQLVAIEMGTSSDIVILHRIDPSSNSIIGSDTTSCYDISDNMYVDNGFSYLPHNTGLAQSGDYVYVSYYVYGENSTTPFVDEAEVAVFSYPELEYVTTITDSRTGPIGGWATNSGLFIDEDGNVYAVSHTNPANGFSQWNATAGILKIDKNSTAFNADYFFDLTATGDGYTTANVMYMEDGKAFAEMNVAERSAQTKWSDAPLKSAILDLDAKTVTYFADCPEHNGMGRDIVSTALYDGGLIYSPITDASGKVNVYTFDPSDMSSTKGVSVDAEFIAGIFRLN